MPAPKPKIEPNSIIFAINIIRKSNLTGWHSTQLISNSKETGTVALCIPEISLTRAIGIRYHGASVLTPATLLMIEELKKNVSRELVERGLVKSAQCLIKQSTPSYS